MLAKKKKPRPLLALPFKVFRLARPARKRGAMAIKKNKSISLADLGVAASGPSSPVTNSLQIALPATPRSAIPCSSGVSGSALLSKEEVLGEPAGGATSSDHSSASLVNNSTETAIRTSPVTNDDELVLTMSDTADPAMASMASVSVPIQTVAENGSQANLGNTDPLASDTSVPVNKAYVPATDIDGEDTLG
uniref:Uncharacterized protein n=1 Tax=Brassica campestris TaxID=3711 RepID=M4D2U5_BRACM